MLVDKNTVVKVTNRDSGKVGYKLPEMGINHRQYQPGETKEITVDELRQLNYKPGGSYLIKHCLVIDNPVVVEELLGKVEPEYYYNATDVKNLLLNGSLDQLQDCLDFAPTGVIELVKKTAVELKINDLAKRQAIMDKTGFNVSGAIRVNEEAAEDEEVAQEAPKARRAAPLAKSESTQTTGRRVPAPPKYDVTSIGE